MLPFLGNRPYHSFLGMSMKRWLIVECPPDRPWRVVEYMLFRNPEIAQEKAKELSESPISFSQSFKVFELDDERAT